MGLGFGVWGWDIVLLLNLKLSACLDLSWIPRSSQPSLAGGKPSSPTFREWRQEDQELESSAAAK